MAINLNGKKTSLKEEAEIYKKRADEQPEREKLKHMNAKEKASYFAAYYLPKLLVLVAVVAVAGFLLWSDVLNKRDVVLRCAILNETFTDEALTEFSDQFMASIGEDPDKTTSSFYVYLTRSDIAAENGGNAAGDLSEVTSRIVAADLSCMIASEADGKNYLDNGFFLKMEDFLTEEEYESLKDSLFTAEKGEKITSGSYGIYLDKSPVYQSLPRNTKKSSGRPVLSIITNADDQGKEYARKLIHYLFP